MVVSHIWEDMNMKQIHRYAIKYIDHNGYTTGYGYAESLDQYPDGKIIDAECGTRIKIDFELSANVSTAGHLVRII